MPQGPDPQLPSAPYPPVRTERRRHRRAGCIPIGLAIRAGDWHASDMKCRVSMDPSGRLVLPMDIRRSLNVAGRAVFEVELAGNRLELTLTDAAPFVLRRKGKLLAVPGRDVPVDAVSAVEETRNDRLRSSSSATRS